MKDAKLFFFCFIAIVTIFVAFAFHKGKLHTTKIITPRLVILYATCTLNREFIEPYHPGIRFTPNFKAFAEHSYVFLRHQTEVGFSGASFAALFSGEHVYNNGVYYHPAFLNDKNYLIAEAFRDGGYETFFWNGIGIASAKLNYGQGVDAKNISHRVPQDGVTLSEKDATFAAILKRVKQDPNYKAFIEINFTMSHAPYSWYSNVDATKSFCKDFPEECKGVTDEDIAKYLPIHEKNFGNLSYHFDDAVKALQLTQDDIEKMAGALEVAYKSCIHRLDGRFGATMDAIQKIGVLDKSLVVFTADHGEVLYRKDYYIKWGHWGLAPDVLDVPLIVRLPQGLPQPKTYANVSSSIDVFPTVAGLSNVQIAKNRHLDGQDLSAALLGDEAPPDEIVYSTQGLPHPADMVADVKMMPVEARLGDTIYRYMPRPDRPLKLELFDLQGSTERPRSTALGVNNQIAESLNQYRSRLIHGYTPWADQSDREEVLERLRSLGYLH